MVTEKMKLGKKVLRIGKFLVSTGVNGPGKRFVIWFQGCHFRCYGCFNPEFFDTNKGFIMSIDQVMSNINSAKGIEGVTFTGGEPLLQAESLLPLAKMIKSKGLSILCYTGYLYQQILEEKIHCAKKLLKWIDILIDGQYIEKYKAPLLWRGSRNQKVYFLTDRYKYLEPLALKEGITEVELQVGESSLAITGIFELEMWERLKKETKSRR